MSQHKKQAFIIQNVILINWCKTGSKSDWKGR